MKMKKQVMIWGSIIYIVTSIFLVVKIDHASHDFKNYREYTSKILDGEERLTDWKEWLGLGSFWKDRKDKGEQSEENAQYFYHSALFWSYWLAAASIVYLLFTMLVFRGTVEFYRYLSLSMVLVSVLLLIVGLITPMMEIGAYKDLLEFPIKFNIPIIEQEVDLSKQFDGRMYFFYKNKSVMDVLYTLFAQGNFIVGIFILLFSIINPIMKLSMTVILLFRKSPNSRFMNFIVHNLGKWSMADVFVVANILAFLSFQNMSTGIDTETNVLFGLYFFAGFVILSIFSSMLLKWHGKRIKETVIIH